MTAIGLWAIAASNPEAPAVIAPDGAVVSYAELAREADRYGRGFQALGLVPGDAVAVGRLGDDGTDARPSSRAHGAPMLYTSGTSGRPKGVRRPLAGMDLDDIAF